MPRSLPPASGTRRRQPRDDVTRRQGSVSRRDGVLLCFLRGGPSVRTRRAWGARDRVSFRGSGGGLTALRPVENEPQRPAGTVFATSSLPGHCLAAANDSITLQPLSARTGPAFLCESPTEDLLLLVNELTQFRQIINSIISRLLRAPCSHGNSLDFAFEPELPLHAKFLSPPVLFQLYWSQNSRSSFVKPAWRGRFFSLGLL